MYLVKPFHNQEWDGLHSNWYAPPWEKAESPFLLFKNRIAYCSGKIFEGYFKRAPYQTRVLLGNIIEKFLPRPKFRSSTLPSYARVFVQTRDNMELLHILSYIPELRGEAVTVEERIALTDMELSLRMDDEELKAVYLAPDRIKLEARKEDGYYTVRLPFINGYALVVFEKDSRKKTESPRVEKHLS